MKTAAKPKSVPNRSLTVPMLLILKKQEPIRLLLMETEHFRMKPIPARISFFTP